VFYERDSVKQQPHVKFFFLLLPKYSTRLREITACPRARSSQHSVRAQLGAAPGRRRMVDCEGWMAPHVNRLSSCDQPLSRAHPSIA
jgi:hypothetical protein